MVQHLCVKNPIRKLRKSVCGMVFPQGNDIAIAPPPMLLLQMAKLPISTTGRRAVAVFFGYSKQPKPYGIYNTELLNQAIVGPCTRNSSTIFCLFYV